MALLQDYGLVFDAVICLLLVVTIGYAVALNRKLTLLRDAKRDMEKLFAEFASATSEAQGGLMALKEGSGTAGQALAKNVGDACRLADEMAFLVKKGNEIADRLEVQIAASRKAAQAAPPPLHQERPQAPQPAAPPRTQAPQPREPETLGKAALQSGALDAVKNGAPRGIAKLAKRKLSEADSELLRTLQAIR
ncbi:DUF6468 domain-containing protein [Pelagibius sp. CAU 1746]|uniref:DUF6468 domain-containing protein n=1 Tax=Pelagibius sp. CAU 1746 TaxID=3140370 RepID=UPI00325A6861